MPQCTWAATEIGVNQEEQNCEVNSKVTLVCICKARPIKVPHFCCPGNSKTGKTWIQRGLEQFTYTKCYWFIFAFKKMFQEVVLDPQWNFRSEEAEHTEPGVRIWMRENRVSGVSCPGNPLGSEGPKSWVGGRRGVGRVWRLLRAPRVKSAAPLRRNIYYTTEMALNLWTSVMWDTKSTK